MKINTATKELREKIINDINTSNLPEINVLLVIENIRQEVFELYQKALRMEEEAENVN